MCIVRIVIKRLFTSDLLTINVSCIKIISKVDDVNRTINTSYKGYFPKIIKTKTE